MLPALTTSRARLPTRRTALASASLVLGLLAVATQIAAAPQPVERSTTLADELRASTWAMTVPTAWLAAPVPSVHRGDKLDIVAVRPGERPFTLPVAYAASVMSVDDRAIVLDVEVDDAIALASAHGAGLLLVPLLRSTK